MRARFLFILLIGVLVSLLFVQPASAAGRVLESCRVTENGEIEFTFSHYGRDLFITIVPYEEPIPANACTLTDQDWWEWGNTITDTYLFAYDTVDNVRMVLQFVPREDGIPQANIYINKDDQDGVMGRQRLARPDDFTFVTNPQGQRELQMNLFGGHPYIIMYPREDDDWLVDGKTNYNLKLFIDGIYPLGPEGLSWQTTNGTMNWEAEAGGSEPGIADYQVFRMVNDEFPGRGYTRLGASMRMEASEPFPDVPPFETAETLLPPFPYLEFGLDRIEAFQFDQLGGDVRHTRETPMPLYFNMRDEQFELHGFAGFQNGGMYYYNSVTEAPIVNFESPFIFYNFNDENRDSHLLIRGSPYVEDDTFGPDKVPNPYRNRLSFRYSWKTGNEGLNPWRYSFDVAGYDYTLDQPVTIGDVEILGLRPEDAPEWVMDKEWPLVTFVEATEGFNSTEGIYAYTAQAGHNWPWIDGRNEHPPEHFVIPYLEEGDGTNLSSKSDLGLPENFRGEYNTAYFHEPRVYFSPIDNRMHLWHAEGGIWNVDQQRVLRMHNLNGDAYIDGWTLERVPEQEPPEVITEPPWWPKAYPGELQEALYTLDDYIIYTGPDGSELRQAEYELSLYETVPPTDKQTWTDFVDELNESEDEERSPEDLQSWLDEFPGDTLLATEGRLQDMRATEDGFRFVLTIEDGDEVANDLTGQTLTPGDYLVTHDGDGDFRIEELTPPEPVVDLQVMPMVQWQPGKIQVRTGNTGLADLYDATFSITPVTSDGIEGEPFATTIDFLAGEENVTTLDWTPPQGGEWYLVPRVYLSDDREDVLGFDWQEYDSFPVAVQAGPSTGSFDILQLTSSPFSLGFSLLVLGSLASMAALVFWHSIARPGPAPARQPRQAPQPRAVPQPAPLGAQVTNGAPAVSGASFAFSARPVEIINDIPPIPSWALEQTGRRPRTAVQLQAEPGDTPMSEAAAPQKNNKNGPKTIEVARGALAQELIVDEADVPAEEENYPDESHPDEPHQENANPVLPLSVHLFPVRDRERHKPDEILASADTVEGNQKPDTAVLAPPALNNLAITRPVPVKTGEIIPMRSVVARSVVAAAFVCTVLVVLVAVGERLRVLILQRFKNI